MTNKYLFFSHILFLFITSYFIGSQSDITGSAFYCLNVTSLSVNVLYFPFLDNIYWDFWNPYDLLDLPRALIHVIYTTDVSQYQQHSILSSTILALNFLENTFMTIQSIDWKNTTTSQLIVIIWFFVKLGWNRIMIRKLLILPF